MPYPGQVDQARIVEQARAMIEAEGVEAMSLQKLATALGVKAPSLYRHVGSKAELLRAVNAGTIAQLISALHDAGNQQQGLPQARLVAILRRFRQFAHAHPQCYLLFFTAQIGDTRPDEAWLVELVLPIQALMAEIVGEVASLSALRGALALAHGFVMLELHQQLQRGGDLEATFVQAIEVYLRGLATAG
ncbi:MAG: TetR/AcrR family transcriptional regulator [Caldilineaceae bacterium]